MLYLDTVEAAGRSPLTVACYRTTLQGLLSRSHGLPDELAVMDYLSSFPSVNSRFRIHNIIRQWFKFLISRGLVDKDPSRSIPRPIPQRRNYAPLSLEEFTALCSHLDPMMRVFAGVLYYVGSRVTETCQIRVEDVRFEGSGGTIDFPYRKRGKGGFAAFGPELAPALRHWLAGKPVWAFSAPKTSSLPLNRQTAYARLRTAARMAKIPGVLTPHRLRHDFTNRAVDANWNLLALQQQLGHSDPASTAWYFNPTRHRLMNVYAKAFGDRAAQESS